MITDRAPVSKWAVRGLYFFTFVLVFLPAADLITNTWPVQLGSLQWRHGFMGLLAGFLHMPILGLVLAMALAYAMAKGKTLRLLSALSLVGATCLLAVFLFFALDVIQIRGSIPAERLPSFKAGALIAELKHLTSCVALGLLGTGGWKTAAQFEVNEPKHVRTPAIVMKSSVADVGGPTPLTGSAPPPSLQG